MTGVENEGPWPSHFVDTIAALRIVYVDSCQ